MRHPISAAAAALLAAALGVAVTRSPITALAIVGGALMVGYLWNVNAGAAYKSSVGLLVIVAAGPNWLIYDAGGFTIYASTLALVFVTIAALRLLRSRTSEMFWIDTAKTAIFGYISLAILAAGSHIFSGPTPSFGANLLRLAFLSAFIVALSPAYQFAPGLIRLSYWTLSVNCAVQVVIFLGNGISISNRIYPPGQGGPNAFAAMICILITLRVALLPHVSRRANLADLVLGLPTLGTALIFTYSRGAVLGLSAGLVVLAIQSYRRRPALAAAVIAAIVTASVWATTASSLRGRFDNFSLAAASGRDEIFHRAISGFSENPLIGQGFGASANLFTTGEGSAHNVPLQVAFELGTVGLIIVSLILIAFCRTFYSTPVLPAGVALGVISLSDNHFLVVQFVWCVALIVAMGLHFKREPLQKDLVLRSVSRPRTAVRIFTQLQSKSNSALGVASLSPPRRNGQ